ncbi:arginyltransferase [Helicobacter burdigaliensis]|uniref:arginyltransferase n=1 Tax=Helicobacter burdigaliensis TaxID=2315334 RepID=UPI000EF6DDF8|nr:arginyltransferase [Helicobacter burdigaliensis]
MEIFELKQNPKICGYFKDKVSLFRYFYIKECEEVFYKKLLERGWRRFGNYFFVPECGECNLCVSIRWDCEKFNFSTTQKRILKQSSFVTLSIQKPTLSKSHLELYDKYHKIMQDKKGWEYQKISPEIYYDTFVQGFMEFGYEFLYHIEGNLVGVALVDILQDCLSAVYCFYDHDFAKYSLGTFSILKQIEFAKTKGIKYIYPGYWIENHPSMGYKEKFKPFEVLINRPTLEEEPIWVKEQDALYKSNFTSF